ncbi:MAG TPA: hypothetical protein VF875_04800 [Anaeromyxobacter sp.]
MKLQANSKLFGAKYGIDHLPLPFAFTSDPFTIRMQREDATSCRALAEVAVDASSLSVEPDELDAAGEVRNTGGVIVSNPAPVWEFIGAVVDALALLYDAPLTVTHAGADELIPENAADEGTLRRLGTNRVVLRIRGNVRVVGPMPVSNLDIAVRKLLPKHAGLRLYSEAAHLQGAVSQYRELWRVLESAFGREGEGLVELLSTFKPALAMGFTKREIKGLLVLRGRASHAASKGGLREVMNVSALARSRLGRLDGLVKRVLVTKKSWGQPTTAVEEVVPDTGHVGPPDEPDGLDE